MKEEINDLLNIAEDISRDDSVEEKRFIRYQADKNKLNIGDRIALKINDKDSNDLLCDSWIVVKGHIKSTTATAFTKTNCPTLCNNGPLHLFDEITLEINGKTIETVKLPAIAVLLKRLTFDYRDNERMFFIKSLDDRKKILPGLNKDSDVGRFEFHIPLNEVLDFCSSYRAIMFKSTKTLFLSRIVTGKDYSIIRTEDPEATIELDAIEWVVPQLILGDSGRHKKESILANKSVIPIAYSEKVLHQFAVTVNTDYYMYQFHHPANRRPVFAIVAFQNDKKADQKTDNSVFDHANIRQIFITYNNVEYPHTTIKDIDFTDVSFINAYSHMMMARDTFLDEFVGREHDSKAVMSLEEYRSKYPLFVFDLSKCRERVMTSGVVDLKLEVHFSNKTSDSLKGYVLLIGQSLVSFNTHNELFTQEEY